MLSAYLVGFSCGAGFAGVVAVLVCGFATVREIGDL